MVGGRAARVCARGLGRAGALELLLRAGSGVLLCGNPQPARCSCFYPPSMLSAGMAQGINPKPGDTGGEGGASVEVAHCSSRQMSPTPRVVQFTICEARPGGPGDPPEDPFAD